MEIFHTCQCRNALSSKRWEERAFLNQWSKLKTVCLWPFSNGRIWAPSKWKSGLDFQCSHIGVYHQTFAHTNWIHSLFVGKVIRRNQLGLWWLIRLLQILLQILNITTGDRTRFREDACWSGSYSPAKEPKTELWASVKPPNGNHSTFITVLTSLMTPCLWSMCCFWIQCLSSVLYFLFDLYRQFLRDSICRFWGCEKTLTLFQGRSEGKIRAQGASHLLVRFAFVPDSSYLLQGIDFPKPLPVLTRDTTITLTIKESGSKIHRMLQHFRLPGLLYSS